MKPIILSERLLLLALRNDKGTVVSSSAIALPFALNGAVLLDLVAKDAILVEKKAVTVINDTPVGDPVLDEALASIGSARRVRSLNHWIARSNGLVKGLKQQLLDRLVDRGILRRSEHRFLGLIPYRRYPSLDGQPARELRQRIQDTVLHGSRADESTALLIALVGACELARAVFPDRRPREVKRRLKKFTDGELVSGAVARHVASATAAMIVSCTAASTAAASSGG